MSTQKCTFLNCKTKQSSVTRTQSVAYEKALSFDQKFQKDNDNLILEEVWPEEGASANITGLQENELKKLIPLLWDDLTKLYDRHNLPFHKRKPNKDKNREDSNVFGISLLTLINKDRLVVGDTECCIPKVLRLLLEALMSKVSEEGILRKPGNNKRVKYLCNEIEKSFYSEPNVVEDAINSASCHDLAATLKKLLKELPQPILTTELIQLFYQTHVLEGSAQGKALNLLVLLMPFEHRATLLSLLKLMNQIPKCLISNKMTQHNVAMIIGPTLFPQSFIIKNPKGLEAYIEMAANCCKVTEALMKYYENLWLVPPSLDSQLDRKPNIKKNSITNTE